ncbi:MAG: metallophosphoesterase [Anaerolineae bacterium]|nr:metallophosphoesterase [Anaerolineae bacterium]
MAQFPQKITIAVLTDVHYGAGSTIAQRRSEIADILLLRAVHRLNRLIHPDITVVLGDLVDDGASPDTPQRLASVREILDVLISPHIVIPGNHDGDTDAFYRVFDRPEEIVDIGGVRFLPFIDQEEPGYNASRCRRDIQRLRRARAETTGPIVALQHVCLTPPNQTDSPYNYTNAPEIIEAMGDAGVELSISGHHHAGAPLVKNGTTSFVTAPSLCEAPFLFVTVTLDQGQVTLERHQLAMPEHLGLVDRHVHTQLAYCSEDMRVDRAIALAKDFGLAGIGFSEHSGQLYFDRDGYWDWWGQWAHVGLAGARDQDYRVPAYLDLKQRYQAEGVAFGVEADIDYHGNLILRPEDRSHFDHILGAIHRTPSLRRPPPPCETLEAEFMVLLERLLGHDIDVLAHLFRLFRRSGYGPPEKLFRPTAELLQQHDIAVEINYHTNEPPIEFIRMCLDLDVKFSFGGDAHNLYEIGEFADHLKLLTDAGFDGDLADILCHLNYRARNG